MLKVQKESELISYVHVHYTKNHPKSQGKKPGISMNFLKTNKEFNKSNLMKF